MSAESAVDDETVVVSARRMLTAGVCEFELRRADGTLFEPAEPGSHIAVHTPSGEARSYSLTSDVSDRSRRVIAVRRDESDQLHAWVEVAFDDAGWVAFDPTPPKDQVPQEEAPKPKSDPKAQVLQPPPPPQEPADLPPDIRTDDTDQDDEPDSNAILATVLIASGSLLGLLIVLMTPVVVIGALKARRRKARQNAERPADRLSGGWDEIVDRADDLGTPVGGRGVTRRADAAVLAEAWPALPVAEVAVRADHGVFGPGEPSQQEVDAFWAEVNDIVRGMHDSRGWWKRLRARVSLRAYIGRRLESRRRRRRARS